MGCMLSGKRKGRSCLLVLSEKKHCEVIIRKPRSAKAESVVKALDRLERKLGAEAFRECCKSITMDNGPEFSDWRSLVRSRVTGKRRASAYYCHPYTDVKPYCIQSGEGFYCPARKETNGVA